MSRVRLAALTYVALGLGFGLGSAITMLYHARHGDLPMTPFGFRSMAGGPFEGLGPRALQALGWTLAGVCALDVLAGVWLWQGRARGARLGLLTDVPALVLGVTKGGGAHTRNEFIETLPIEKGMRQLLTFVQKVWE